MSRDPYEFLSALDDYVAARILRQDASQPREIMRSYLQEIEDRETGGSGNASGSGLTGFSAADEAASGAELPEVSKAGGTGHSRHSHCACTGFSVDGWTLGCLCGHSSDEHEQKSRGMCKHSANACPEHRR